MGKGRRPKPLEIRKLQGNAGRRRIPHVRKAAPVDENNPPPKWLIAEGKVIWRKVVADNAAIELITDNDLNTLAMYCNAVARFIEAEKNSHPAVIIKKIKVKLKKGWKVVEQLVKNPWITIARNYFDEATKLGAQFGFSPVDRVKTGVIPPAKSKEENEIENFFNRKKA